MHMYLRCYSSSSLVDIMFYDRVGGPPHNTPLPGVLMKSIEAAFSDQMPFLSRQPHI